jgi:myotubularin-related protein 9
VFLLFLDCVWQVLRQYPCSFGFSEALLVQLCDHAHASDYGTFLGNTPRDRVAAALPSRTASLWALLLAQPDERRKLENPLFRPTTDLVRPSFRAQSLGVWLTLYGRWTHNVEPYAEAQELVRYVCDREQMLAAEVAVQARALELKRAACAALQAEVDAERAKRQPAADPTAAAAVVPAGPAVDPLLGIALDS